MVLILDGGMQARWLWRLRGQPYFARISKMGNMVMSVGIGGRIREDRGLVSDGRDALDPEKDVFAALCLCLMCLQR